MEVNEFERQILEHLGKSEKTIADLYLTGEEAVLLIEMARNSEFLILGIDGFRQESTGLIADLSLIADFSAALSDPVSWTTRVEKSCRDALAFVESGKSNSIRFNFVIADQPVI